MLLHHTCLYKELMYCWHENIANGNIGWSCIQSRNILKPFKILIECDALLELLELIKSSILNVPLQLAEYWGIFLILKMSQRKFCCGYLYSFRQSLSSGRTGGKSFCRFLVNSVKVFNAYNVAKINTHVLALWTFPHHQRCYVNSVESCPLRANKPCILVCLFVFRFDLQKP